jgi:VWFA-related protein
MLFHRYKWSAAVVLFALPWVLFAAAANDFPTVRYRATVSEVRITFFASDENNRPVNKIEKDDFAVVDSGMVVRDFRSLLPADETALDVVAVVDASQSVAPRLQATVHDVLQLVSQRQLAADDNVSVMAFSGLQPVLICARNCRSAAAGQRLLAVKAAGATPLFDALAYGADFISRRRTPGVRPVLILFSDGDDTISKTSARDAVEAVIASGALLYTIDLNKPADAWNGSAALQHMAEMTGGRYFPVGEGAARVLQTALDDLRASYVVTYPLPSHAVGFHSLRILPKHNLNLRFHCRNGYYYETSIP